MKNKEKYLDEILEAFTNVYVDNCDFRTKYVLKQKGCCEIRCDECNLKTAEWLEQEYQEPSILDEKEKEYLSAVIRPWRNNVSRIIKLNYVTHERIAIETKTIDIDIRFPLFEKGTMYKGMELNKPYTLEELGI